MMLAIRWGVAAEVQRVSRLMSRVIGWRGHRFPVRRAVSSGCASCELVVAAQLAARPETWSQAVVKAC